MITAPGLKTTKADTERYIRFIRSISCIVCGGSPVDPDHLQHRGMGGAGKGGTATGTVLDYSCIPLCRVHHSERHSLGINGFEKKYRLNLWREAFTLLRRYFLK